MAKMTKNQLIDAIAEATQISKGDVKSVIEQMATVGYKELNESGEFVILGFVGCEQARYRSSQWLESLHERANGIRGQACQQVG